MQEPNAGLHGPEHGHVLDGLLHLQGQDPEVQAQLQRWVHGSCEHHSSLLCRVLHTRGVRVLTVPLPGQEWGSPQKKGKPGTLARVTGFTPSRPRNLLATQGSFEGRRFTHPFAGGSQAPQPRAPQPQAEHRETQPQTGLRRGVAEGQPPGNTMELKLRSKKPWAGNFTSTHYKS